ncbi:SAM-dependent methyltransferase [Streptomyces sp. NPDC050549]|uniref:SAM-dependent methyltransferase n=1 Tax=Streptomyces sp. NPDC050549 TaxID=3155406 RepID=UPI0034201BB3
MHEVAALHHPDTTVVHVDNDPTVLAHGRPLLRPGRSHLLLGDVEDMASVLDHPDLHTLIDLSAPLGALSPSFHAHSRITSRSSKRARRRRRISCSVMDSTPRPCPTPADSFQEGGPVRIGRYRWPRCARCAEEEVTHMRVPAHRRARWTGTDLRTCDHGTAASGALSPLPASAAAKCC